MGRRLPSFALIVVAVATALAATVTPASTAAIGPPRDGRWVPARGVTWQWQLSGRADLNYSGAVFDLDVDETPAATVARLHDMGRHVICYIDVGTWESYRADAAKFPKRLLGKAVDGWPNERWLDIRHISTLAPILRARFDRCRAKRFDAIEPDWLDAYDQVTGFRITKADSIRFDKWVAAEAHKRGLSIAQKNAPGLVRALRGSFDFALVEECFQYKECGSFAAYLRDGVAVLDAEYALAPSAFCASARRYGISAIRKRLALDAWRRTCP